MSETLMVLKALADDTRLKILRALNEQDMYVELIAERMQLTPATVSFHMKKLMAAGLVDSRREQYYTVYSLRRDMFNMTLGELNHGRSPLGWLVWAVLTVLLNASYKKGKPDLNVLFQYNMPLRALAKMTNGAISMGMVDGIVMEVQGFWVIGLVRVIFEAVKNVILNAQLENRLRNS